MPYTPTVQDRTGEFLMRGITGAADNIGQAIERRRTDAQKAKALRQTLSIYDDSLKDQVQSMGLKDLEGMVAGLGMKHAKAQMDQQAKLTQAQIDNYGADNSRANAFLKLQQDQAAAADAERKRQLQVMTSFARDYAAPAVPGVSSVDVLKAAAEPNGRMLRALANNPGAMNPDMLQNLLRYAPEQTGAAEPKEFTAGNMSGVYSPKTGAFQADRKVPTELTPAEKQRAIASLNSQKRSLVLALVAPTTMDEGRQQIEAQLADLDEELAALGAKKAPAKDSGSGKAVGRFNPQTGKFERY